MRVAGGTGLRRIAAVLVGAVLLASGCAYFNTFYNAKSSFKKAEHERTHRTGSMGADNYQKCIDKCQLLLRYYPKSKYVDDALFLMGMSRLYRGEAIQASAAFEELLQRFPDTEYAERAYYGMGLAALKQNDPASAAQAFEQLEARFPKSALVTESAFRSAEARLDARDTERARDELRAFIAAHPESPLAVDAQVRLARTYYEEKLYPEAQAEYQKVLDQKNTPETRFEAELAIALSQRAQVEEVLVNPVYQQARRRAWEASPRRQEEPQRAPASAPGGRDGTPPRTMPGGQPGAPNPDAGYPPAPDAPQFGEEGAYEAQRPEDESPRATDADERPAASPPSGAAPTLPPAAGAAPAGPTAEAQSFAATDTATTIVLDSLQLAELRNAELELDAVTAKLQSLRKPAAKLGRQQELDIELAVTRGLRGDPGAAIDDLDQMARAKPRTEFATRARFEIGEIHRRMGNFDEARQAYDDALKEKRDAPSAEKAQKMSTAIVARNQAAEKLEGAPEVLERWNAQQARSAPGTGRDSIEAEVALQTQFEELASQQLRLAEIDLLDLDQPLVALDEFEQVVAQYPGSLQVPRARFGIAWIYHHRLRDLGRAKRAYETVVREHPDTPQGRESQAILAQLESGAAEVKDPSSQP